MKITYHINPEHTTTLIYFGAIDSSIYPWNYYRNYNNKQNITISIEEDYRSSSNTVIIDFELNSFIKPIKDLCIELYLDIIKNINNYNQQKIILIGFSLGGFISMVYSVETYNLNKKQDIQLIVIDSVTHLHIQKLEKYNKKYNSNIILEIINQVKQYSNINLKDIKVISHINLPIKKALQNKLYDPTVYLTYINNLLMFYKLLSNNTLNQCITYANADHELHYVYPDSIKATIDNLVRS